MEDPFNPDGGAFAKNIRAITGLDDTELKESLKRFGWLKEFPALADENDVVLVGHRRIRLAKQLNITPVIKTLRIGKGDEADARRFALAIASNLGHAPMTKDDRKRIAEYLYGEKEWTMPRIAEALNVTHKTISKDLDEFVPKVQTSRPKGGRPKGSKAPRQKARVYDDAAKEEVIAKRVLDDGVSMEKAAAEANMGSVQQAKIAVAKEQGRREARGQVDSKTLSMSAQEKLEAAIRQHKKKLDVEFEQRVQRECKQRMNELGLPELKKLRDEAKKALDARRGFMTKETFNTIRRALHPDSRNSISDAKLGGAFDEFMRLEKYLLNEKNSPTTYPDLPNTMEGWEAMKRKARTTKHVPTVR